MSGGDLVDDGIEEDFGVEEFGGGRRILLDVAWVVVVWTVLFAGAKDEGIFDHTRVEVVDEIVRNEVVDNDKTVLMQGANGDLEMLWCKTRVSELGL